MTSLIIWYLRLTCRSNVTEETHISLLLTHLQAVAAGSSRIYVIAINSSGGPLYVSVHLNIVLYKNKYFIAPVCDRCSANA